MYNNCFTTKFVSHISNISLASKKIIEGLPLSSKPKDIYAMVYG